MYYYQVWVASSSYKGNKPLTYSHDSLLKNGLLVAVPLQKKRCTGLIAERVAKPNFSTLAIRAILTEVPVPNRLLKLIDWLKAYYPGSSGDIMQACLPSSLSQLAAGKLPADTPTATTDTPPEPPLPAITAEQKAAVNKLKRLPAGSFLLHGFPGSGKTRVYLEYAKYVWEKGQSSLIMTAEIGLIPQIEKTFRSVFGENVVIFHSNLTPAQRRDAWLQILHAKGPQIIIGPRSALFMPFKKLGLVVMDEAHESAYKQDQAPRYQASRVAAQLARIHGAVFIMGSGTPLVADYYAYEQKKLPIVEMPSMAMKEAIAPEVITVPLGERDQFSRSPYLSKPMIEAVGAALQSHEQSLIYLNRRGSARMILCQDSGWQALCPKCDAPYVYHGDLRLMLCHICGRKQSAPTSCPECKSTNIVFRSIGTKSLVDEVKRLFPEASISRFDTDNKKHERLESLYEDVLSGKIDILVGTQLLGKGLDLPRLSVVGVVQADTSLSIPDYTADEKTYQQLVQIIGRVGRGHRKGTVVIQSRKPSNPAIQAAIKADYRLFYEQELLSRQKFRFPPFYYLLKLSCHRSSPKGAEKAATELKKSLSSRHTAIEIVGPSPSFHEKRAGTYYWQLIIKSRQRNRLIEVIEQLPSGWTHDIDPANLL